MMARLCIEYLETWVAWGEGLHNSFGNNAKVRWTWCSIIWMDGNELGQLQQKWNAKPFLVQFFNELRQRLQICIHTPNLLDLIKLNSSLSLVPVILAAAQLLCIAWGLY